MPPNNLEANVRISLANTIQALRFSKSTLGLVRLIPTDPIIPLYEAAVQDLTDAVNAFADLPFLPVDPVTPSLQDNSLIIRLANERTLQAIARTDDAIGYLDRAISNLNPGSDLPGPLVSIRGDLASARTALNTALDFSA